MYIPIHEEIDAQSESQLSEILTARGWTENQVRQVQSTLERTYANEDQYQHADNLRLARADHADEVRAYNWLWINGCCGAFDEAYAVEGAVDVMVGFNYGH